MQQDGGTAGVEPASPHPSPHQTSLRAQSLPASFLRARGPALLAQAELHVRRVYPRDFRARPQPPPPRRPRPSTPPHIREAAQCRAYATRGENRAERRRSAVRAGRPLGLRVAARRTARGRGWRAGAGPSVRTRWDRHRVGGVEEDRAGVRQARRRLGTRPAFLERLWAKRALPVSLALLLFLPLFWLGAVQASRVIQFGFCETTEAHYNFFSLPYFLLSVLLYPHSSSSPSFSFILGTKPRPQACRTCALLLAPLALFTFPL